MSEHEAHQTTLGYHEDGRPITRHVAWDDTERIYGTITNVDVGKDGHRYITFREPGMSGGGTSVGIPPVAECVDDYEPRVGDLVTVWSGGLGTITRGAACGDRVLYYRTKAEADARLKAELDAHRAKRRHAYETEQRAEHDALMATWEAPWQVRLVFLRGQDTPDWWDYEGYEVRCIQQARAIVAELQTPEEIGRVYYLPYKEKEAALNGQYMPGHSGNSDAFSFRLAMLYLQAPHMLYLEHAAICPLVGCESAGCAAAYAPEDMGEVLDAGDRGLLVEPQVVKQTAPRWIGEE